MPQTWRRVLCVGCLVAVFTGACSDDSDPVAAPTPQATAVPERALPPSTLEGLRPLFEPIVAPFGVRLTRGSLADVDTRQYDPAGRHLALYVEPTSAWTDTQFVATIAPLTRALAPELFRRWPDLASFDVCQEPWPGTPDQDEDSSLTIVDMNREVAESIDWNTVDLTALIVAAIERPAGMHLAVSEPLNQDALYRLAESQARSIAESADTPSG